MGKDKKEAMFEETYEPKEMSVAEARQIRKAAYVESEKTLTEQDKREAFRLFWATEKSKYGKNKDIEHIIWLHLKATQMTTPDKFEAGIKHFGLNKIR